MTNGLLTLDIIVTSVQVAFIVVGLFFFFKMLFRHFFYRYFFKGKMLLCRYNKEKKEVDKFTLMDLKTGEMKEYE